MTITPSMGEPRNPAVIDPKSSVMTLPIAYAIVTNAVLRARNKFQMETFSVAVVDGGGHLTGLEDRIMHGLDLLTKPSKRLEPPSSTKIIQKH